MKTYHCPNCKMDLQFDKPQLFGGHIRSCRKNGNKPAPPVAKAAKAQTPHDPLSHLALAIEEIDARSEAIRAELQGKAALEKELDALQLQREYIVAAQVSIAKRQNPQPEAAHEHSY